MIDLVRSNRTSDGSVSARVQMLKRRSVLQLGSAAVLASARVGRTSTAHAYPASSEIVMLDGTALSDAIRTRQVSCVEVMNAYLDQIGRLNPRVNAIVALQDREALLKQARERDEQLGRGEYQRWLHGFPQAIKDLVSVKGIRST